MKQNGQNIFERYLWFQGTTCTFFYICVWWHNRARIPIDIVIMEGRVRTKACFLQTFRLHINSKHCASVCLSFLPSRICPAGLAYMLNCFSHVLHSLQPYGLTIACQAPLSMGFSRQEYWSKLPYINSFASFLCKAGFLSWANKPKTPFLPHWDPLPFFFFPVLVIQSVLLGLGIDWLVGNFVETGWTLCFLNLREFRWDTQDKSVGKCQ